MDKIAEHIAKFNAPKDAEFYWVSNNSSSNCERYKNEMDLSFLMLKKDFENWVYFDELGRSYDLEFAWPHTIKHEQKGEK